MVDEFIVNHLHATMVNHAELANGHLAYYPQGLIRPGIAVNTELGFFFCTICCVGIGPTSKMVTAHPSSHKDHSIKHPRLEDVEAIRKALNMPTTVLVPENVIAPLAGLSLEVGYRCVHPGCPKAHLKLDTMI